jgi:aminomethyltransferase
MLRSPLHSRHEELGARLLPFAGWEMPIQYDGIVAEHRAVRNQLGVFDISHMGEFLVSGKDVTEWLNGILTNDVRELEDGQGQYTLMLNEAGGAIDDLILYREAKERYFLVVNASKIEQDEAWLKRKLRDGIVFENQSAEWGGLAVQGPKSTEIWNQLEPKFRYRIETESFGVVQVQSFVEPVIQEKMASSCSIPMLELVSGLINFSRPGPSLVVLGHAIR